MTRLRELGGTYRAIAAAAGVGPMTVHDIATGRRPATAGTAAALLAVTGDSLPRGRVDAGGTRLRLRALHVMGHSSARIARAAGASEKTIRKLVRGDAKTVSPRLRDAITAVYDAWWDKRPPQRTRAERTAAAAPGGAPSPGTGAPAPPSMTTSSTSPDTSPPTTGGPPRAPVSPPTSTRHHSTTRKWSSAHENQRR